MKTVLITGANGHIGANLVRELFSRGQYELKAMVRSSSDLRGLAGLPLTPAPGDILDAKRVSELAEGCDAIVNLAAVYSLTSRDLDAILAPAVTGIEHVLSAAARHHVRRVIHVSSMVAVGPSDDPSIVRATNDWNEDAVLPYHQAKTQSERRAWARARELGVDLVCINPGGILGPWDFKPTPSMAYLADMANGKAQTIPGGFNYVDVRDVAWLIAEALERGPSGRYLCGGENLDLKAWAALIQPYTGRKVAHLNLPRWVLLLLAWVVGAVFRRLGKPAPFDYEGMVQLTHRWLYADCASTIETFGLKSRDGATQIADALRWLAWAGMLDSEVATRVSAALPPDPSWGPRTSA